MAKLCPKGKAAAKRKFKVYPSAYANMYASGVCSGKIKPGGRKKAKDGGIQKAGLARRKRCLKKMGFREMGRYWSSEEGWKISTLWKKQRKQKEVSEMRPTCKSHTDDKRAKGECCQTKKSCG